MAHAEGSITIDRPVNTVFNFIADGTNNPLWRSSVTDIERVPGKPTGLGAVFKQGLKGPGGRIDGDYEIVEYQPDQLIRFQVIAGPARPTGTYKFEAVGSSTRVTFILHFEPKGLTKLMDPMITSSRNPRLRCYRTSRLIWKVRENKSFPAWLSVLLNIGRATEKVADLLCR